MVATADNSLAKPLLTAAAAAVGVSILGGLMTDLGSWYEALEKPPWQPADILFAPIWTAIFAMTAAAAVLAWRNSPTLEARQHVIILFLLNATLNVTWSLLFFRLQRPDWAMIEVGFLFASIMLLMYACWHRSKIAVLLLVPYLAWVAFAAVLNAEIVRLNAPFGNP